MESQSAHPVRANLLPTYYQFEIPTSNTNPNTSNFRTKHNTNGTGWATNYDLLI